MLAPKPDEKKPRPLSDRVRRLHYDSLVLDSHVDTTQRLYWQHFDLGTRSDHGGIDLPRMRDGGLGAVFFAIWSPGTLTGRAAVERAFGLVDVVRDEVGRHARDLALARSAEEIERARREGRIAVLLGLEGGHMIGGDLDVLRRLAARGVRYMTLTHAENTDWADAAGVRPAHNGLTAFGKEAIAEMNRLGMVVDVSHVSDKTFWDALAASRAPIFASHSSCRALCDAPRNLSDDMIGALAAAGGLIQINFHVAFLSQSYRDAARKIAGEFEAANEKARTACGEDLQGQMWAEARVSAELTREGKLPGVGWETIVDHIDHAVQLVGADHVGLGSDLDGATMPVGMEDASQLPKITEALLDRGYRDDDIRNILGLNALRLLAQVERVSQDLRAAQGAG